jgi:hypothetical protein
MKISTILIATTALFLIGSCSVGYNYENQVREVSLTLEAASKIESASGSSPGDLINSLNNKLILFSNELASASTKIPAGGEKEKIVRDYFDAAINYLNAKSNFLNAHSEVIAAEKRRHDIGRSNCPPHLLPVNCAIDHVTVQNKNIDNVNRLIEKYNTSHVTVRNTAEALEKARDLAHGLMKNGNIPNMDAFNKIMSEL